AGSFTLTGNLNIEAVVSGSTVSFMLDANATMALTLNNTTIFSFTVTGGIRISNAGVAAALSIQRSGSLPSNLGFGLTASFLLELNTTSADVTFGSITVPHGPSNLFARIHATGDLTFLGNVVDLHGTFDITVTGSSLTLDIHSTIT